MSKRAIEVFLIVILIVIFETTAISCVKEYHKCDKVGYMILAIMGYAIVCYLLNRSFYYRDSMGMINVLWSGLSVMAVATMGVLLFKEKITTCDIISGALIASGVLLFKAAGGEDENEDS